MFGGTLGGGGPNAEHLRACDQMQAGQWKTLPGPPVNCAWVAANHAQPLRALSACATENKACLLKNQGWPPTTAKPCLAVEKPIPAPPKTGLVHGNPCQAAKEWARPLWKIGSLLTTLPVQLWTVPGNHARAMGSISLQAALTMFKISLWSLACDGIRRQTLSGMLDTTWLKI